MSVRILLADDHTLMRQGLRRILESHADFDIVNESSSGIEAVEAARQLKPDVAIVDVGMKELNGIEATAQILKHSPHTAVLILSMYDDERYVLRAVKAGARGYVLKNSAGEELIQAIHAVLAGHGVLQSRGGTHFPGWWGQAAGCPRYLRPLRIPHRPRTPGLSTSGRRQQQQGYRQPSQPEPSHGGNPSLADHGENGPAQHRGVGVERGAPRHGDVIEERLRLSRSRMRNGCP